MLSCGAGLAEGEIFLACSCVFFRDLYCGLGQLWIRGSHSQSNSFWSVWKYKGWTTAYFCVFNLQFWTTLSINKLPFALFNKLKRAHRSVAIAIYLDGLLQVSLARSFTFVSGNVLRIEHDVTESVFGWIACWCCWRLRVSRALRSRATVLNTVESRFILYKKMIFEAKKSQISYILKIPAKFKIFWNFWWSKFFSIWKSQKNCADKNFHLSILFYSLFSCKT